MHVTNYTKAVNMILLSDDLRIFDFEKIILTK